MWLLEKYRRGYEAVTGLRYDFFSQAFESMIDLDTPTCRAHETRIVDTVYSLRIFIQIRILIGFPLWNLLSITTSVLSALYSIDLPHPNSTCPIKLY